MTGRGTVGIDPPEFPIPMHICSGLRLLLQAHCYASNVSRDPWDFAVEIGELRRNGMSHGDLRWLICRGFVTHGREVNSAGECQRGFRISDTLQFGRRTCFRLTADGVRVAYQVVADAESEGGVIGGVFAVASSTVQQIVPVWDSDRHRLTVDEVTVKEFKVPSPNQEAVLAALQEEGWPARIDDPLPQVAHLDAKRRLHDTIKSLNRNQKRHLISFQGDGTGEGVRWELVVPEPTRQRSRMSP